MEWLNISTIIVLAVVCFACVITSVILVSVLIYREETTREPKPVVIEEKPIKHRWRSEF
jgi:hypothetical protein